MASRALLIAGIATITTVRLVGALHMRESGQASGDRKVNDTNAAAARKMRFDFDCYTGKGAEYMGIKTMSQSGRTCKNWLKEGSQSPSVKGIGNHNFCRNPGGGKEQPWCFTVDPQKEFELCDVPECKPSEQSPEPWVAPAGSKSAGEEANGPCEYTAPDKPKFNEYRAGRACMNHQGDTWWLISNSNFTVDDAAACEGECVTFPGSKFFTYWQAANATGDGNCGCYRTCVLVAEDLTVGQPSVYRIL